MQNDILIRLLAGERNLVDLVEFLWHAENTDSTANFLLLADERDLVDLVEYLCPIKSTANFLLLASERKMVNLINLFR